MVEIIMQVILWYNEPYEISTRWLVYRSVKVDNGRGTLEFYPLHAKYFEYYVVMFQPCIGTLKLLTQT